MNITVTPMSAVEHAYMQRMAEWAKNEPDEDDAGRCCLHCGVLVDLDEYEDELICFECKEERRASQHADAADRQRDERWADQWESAHDAG